jgi:hypothetical protein
LSLRPTWTSVRCASAARMNAAAQPIRGLTNLPLVSGKGELLVRAGRKATGLCFELAGLPKEAPLAAGL